MENTRGVKTFEDSQDDIKLALKKLPQYFEKFKSPEYEDKIKELVGNYSYFITDLGFINDFLTQKELGDEDKLKLVNLLKMNYVPLTQLLVEDDNLLDSLIYHMTPSEMFNTNKLAA